ncbi:Sir2 family [Fragilaria crotonensis]|nr:Sir2 family [Fragilaria crotonensis]
MVPFSFCSSSPTFAEALASVALLLKSRKKVLVLAGAGISVSCGIPDFRSPHGLYATLDTEELGISCPEDLFDLEHFQSDPRPFFKFAKALYFPLGTDKRVEPSDSHRFLALLEQQKKLLRVYTQNIDGLEEVAGVSAKRMVYAHGSLQWATCCRCKRKVPASEIEDSIRKGEVPLCQVPLTKAEPSRRLKRKRDVADESSHSCDGVLKPGVTFFGEILHDNVRKSLEADRDKADALIVIGTSLSVAPMSKVISYLPPSVPRILINRNVVDPPNVLNVEDDEDEDEEFRENYTFDAYLLGFCDDVTRALVKEMKTMSGTSDEGKLLAALENNDPIFSLDDWQSDAIPSDRIFLFPGAMHKSDDDDLTYTEVANCDGCEGEIIGAIRKCVQCFDYDLCETCYPALSKTHHNGSHTFAIER